MAYPNNLTRFHPGDNIDLRTADANEVRKLAGQGNAVPAFTRLSAKKPPRLAKKTLVLNNTGRDLTCFSVLEIDGLLEEAADNTAFRYNTKGVVFNGVVPTGEEGKAVVILTQSVKAGDYGKCVAFGQAAAYVEILDDEHEYAVPIAGDTSRLESSESGLVRILGRNQDFCIVAIGYGGSENRDYSEVVFRHDSRCGHPAFAGNVTYLSQPVAFTLETLDEVKEYFRTQVPEFRASHYQLLEESTEVPTECIGPANEEEAEVGDLYKGVMPGEIYLCNTNVSEIDETLLVDAPDNLYAIPYNGGTLTELKAVQWPEPEDYEGEPLPDTLFWKILFVPQSGPCVLKVHDVPTGFRYCIVMGGNWTTSTPDMECKNCENVNVLSDAFSANVLTDATDVQETPEKVSLESKTTIVKPPTDAIRSIRKLNARSSGNAAVKKATSKTFASRLRRN